jgi:F0F1-type ATP synthase assembly protein I
MSAAYGLVVALIVGAGGGYFIGSYFHASTLGLILGILLGFATGLYGVYQALNKP